MTDKDIIGEIILTTGETVTLRMPKMRSVIIPILAGEQKSWVEICVTGATGKGWEWFLDLPIADGTSILNRLTPAIEEMNRAAASLNNATTTKH
jgi:hypothetical protein